MDQLQLALAQAVFPVNEFLHHHQFGFEITSDDLDLLAQNRITINGTEHELRYYSVSAIGDTLRSKAEVWKRGTCLLIKKSEMKVIGGSVEVTILTEATGQEPQIISYIKKSKHEVRPDNIVLW